MCSKSCFVSPVSSNNRATIGAVRAIFEKGANTTKPILKISGNRYIFFRPDMVTFPEFKTSLLTKSGYKWVKPWQYLLRH